MITNEYEWFFDYRLFVQHVERWCHLNGTTKRELAGVLGWDASYFNNRASDTIYMTRYLTVCNFCDLDARTYWSIRRVE